MVLNIILFLFNINIRSYSSNQTPYYLDKEKD